jgi:hypothetical protein
VQPVYIGPAFDDQPVAHGKDDTGRCHARQIIAAQRCKAPVAALHVLDIVLGVSSCVLDVMGFAILRPNEHSDGVDLEFATTHAPNALG